MIALGVRSAFSRKFPDEVPWASDNHSPVHGAFLALNATVDHLVPHARGGSNAPENLVTACWPCNFSREDLLLHELGIADPRAFAPVVDEWDGLARIIAKSMKPQGPQRPSPPPPPPPPPDLKLLAHELERLAPLGVSHASGKTFLVHVEVGTRALTPLAIWPDGKVELPWAIGPHKDLFRPFAQAVANAIPGASLYETPKMWRVRRGAASLTAPELVKSRVQIAQALADLASSMIQGSPPSSD